MPWFPACRLLTGRSIYIYFNGHGDVKYQFKEKATKENTLQNAALTEVIL